MPIQLFVDDLQRFGDAGLPIAPAAGHRAADPDTFAPGAQALSTSWPERTPPSMCTSILSPTAATMAGNARMEVSAPSSWRPPWLDTTMASAPLSTGELCVLNVLNTFEDQFAAPLLLTHLTSGQDTRGSNCSLVQDGSDFMSLTSLTWPTRLPKLCRLVPSMPRTPAWLGHEIDDVGEVGRGGAVRPFSGLCGAGPITCRSSVSERTAPGGFRAFWIMRTMASRSRIM